MLLSLVIWLNEFRGRKKQLKYLKICFSIVHVGLYGPLLLLFVLCKLSFMNYCLANNYVMFYTFKEMAICIAKS